MIYCTTQLTNILYIVSFKGLNNFVFFILPKLFEVYDIFIKGHLIRFFLKNVKCLIYFFLSDVVSYSTI